MVSIAIIAGTLAWASGLHTSLPGEVSMESHARTGNDDSPLNPDQVVSHRDLASVGWSLRARPDVVIEPFSVQGDIGARWSMDQRDEGRTGQELHVARLRAEWNVAADFRLSAGIDRPTWGTAYSWNPSSPWADRDANNTDRAPARFLDGSPAASMRATLAGWTFEAIGFDRAPLDASSDRKRDSLDVVVRTIGLLANADLSLAAGRVKEAPWAGASVAMPVGEALEIHAEAAWAARIRESVPVSVPTPAGDLPIFETRTRQNPVDVVAGGQYTFASRVNVLAEYLYHGSGYDTRTWNDIVRHAGRSRELLQTPLAAGAAGFLGSSMGLVGFSRRHYLFGRISVPGLPFETTLAAYARWQLETLDDALAGMSAALPLGDALRWTISGEWRVPSGHTESGAIADRLEIGSSLRLFL